MSRDNVGRVCPYVLSLLSHGSDLCFFAHFLANAREKKEAHCSLRESRFVRRAVGRSPRRQPSVPALRANERPCRDLVEVARQTSAPGLATGAKISTHTLRRQRHLSGALQRPPAPRRQTFPGASSTKDCKAGRSIISSKEVDMTLQICVCLEGPQYVRGTYIVHRTK